MKKFLYFMLVATALTLAACGASDDEQSHGEQSHTNQGTVDKSEDSTGVGKIVSSDLTSELDQVLASLDELKSTTEKSPSDAGKIHSTGIAVEEDWDKIEKQVEEIDPVAYNNIESSLYPLIDEIKKDSPNVVKIKQLIDETIPKVKEFKEAQGS